MTAAVVDGGIRPQPPQQASSLKRLRALAASVPRQADLIILGDSLAASWPRPLLEEAASQGTTVFNYGLPGDRIQNTLWRLHEFDTSHLRPHTVVVLLGTNNLGDGDAPTAIVAGLSTVATLASTIWSRPRVILISIPWRGSPIPGFRDADRLKINRSLRVRHGVNCLDTDVALTVPGAPILENDALHLSERGYSLLSGALAGILQCVD
jgi:lysophospholipase L1-like esterase